jgi:hypothetical protein
MVRAKKRHVEFFVSFLTPVRLSHFDARVCVKEKKTIRTRATTVRKRDNQVMKKREEREREQKKMCFAYVETYR